MNLHELCELAFQTIIHGDYDDEYKERKIEEIKQFKRELLEQVDWKEIAIKVTLETRSLDLGFLNPKQETKLFEACYKERMNELKSRVY